MHQPLVSIVISSFNRLEDLKETVKRVGDISYPNLEIIVVDGGSSDGTVEYLKALHKSKFKTVLIEVDRGVGYTRLVGLKAAKGVFIISLDDDCFLRPDVVEKTVDIFLANPNLGAIGYGYVNPYIDFNEKKYWKPTNFKVEKNKYNSCYDGTLYLSGSAWRKFALEKVGYAELHWFDSSDYLKTKAEIHTCRILSSEIETDLCFNLFVHGYNTVTIPELIAFHKSAPTNRNADLIVANAIIRDIRLVLKYYSLKNVIAKLAQIFYFCLYYSILNKKSLYLKAVLNSLKDSPTHLINKKRLTKSVFESVKFLPIQTVFSWGGVEIYPGAML